MNKRELGKSGIYVSEVALGTMSLPDNEIEAKKIIETAIHAGINFSIPPIFIMAVKMKNLSAKR